MDMSHTSRNKFDFYEVVEILEPDVMPESLWHTQGIIQGMSHLKGGIWEYAVLACADDKELWQLEEQFLRSTGKQMSRDDFFDGTSVKVIVDPKTGEGKLSKPTGQDEPTSQP
jgi:hypothetical protein